ncbi:MAG: general stress protein [Chloroflexota bacterium]|nr:general stress protein [Chloroflexota bacterium]
MPSKKVSVTGIYNRPEEAKQSVRKLQKCGFDIKKISIAGKGYQPCSSLFIIPGFGPIAVGGPLAGAIVKGFGGGLYSWGLKALREGLCSIGIPKESLFRYETALKNGMCLVLVRGGVDEISGVKNMFFASSKAIEIAVHYS